MLNITSKIYCIFLFPFLFFLEKPTADVVPNILKREDCSSINFKNVASSPVKIQFINEFSIRSFGEKAEQLFDSPVDIEVDSFENVYVLESRKCVILKFSPQGDFIKTIGRKGQGPGEFEYPFSLTIDKEDHLIIYDMMRRRWSVLDPEGTLIKNMTPKENPIYFPDKFYLDKKQNMVIGYIPIPKENQGRGYFISKLDENFNLHDILFSRNDVVSNIRYKGISTFPPPHTPSIVWTIDKEDHLYACFNKSYEIQVFDEDGRTIDKIERKIKIEDISKDEQIEVKKYYQRFSQEMRKMINFPKNMWRFMTYTLWMDIYLS